MHYDLRLNQHLVLPMTKQFKLGKYIDDYELHKITK